MNRLPARLQQRLDGELQKDEVLLWAAQPLVRGFMRPAFLIWLLGFPWTIFFAWMAIGEVRHGQPVNAAVAISVTLIGIAIIGVPLWLRRVAQSTIYAISSKRIISIHVRRATVVRSMRPWSVGVIECTEHRDGAGDLTFSMQVKDRDGSAGKETVTHAFHAIPDVRGAARLIAQLMRRDDES